MARRDERRARLRARVAFWSERLKVKARVVRVQRMTRKWGSCSTAGTITLAEDLTDQEAGFQDFVVAHELMHLRVANHGRVFKALMTVYLPGWRRHEVVKGQAKMLRAPKSKEASEAYTINSLSNRNKRQEYTNAHH